MHLWTPQQDREEAPEGGTAIFRFAFGIERCGHIVVEVVSDYAEVPSLSHGESRAISILARASGAALEKPPLLSRRCIGVLSRAVQTVIASGAISKTMKAFCF
jgi:hypothetical protein